jgi:hypothetical protein
VFLSKFQGRTVTFGAWVYSTLATPEVQLRITDGSGTTSSSPAQNTWTWLEVTKTISTSAAYLYFQFDKSGSSAETFYISQPMLVFGSSIGEGNYTRPQGEIVWFENIKASTIFGGSAFSDVTTTMVNLEADSEGIIPKGAKAIMWQGHGRDSGCNSTDCYFHTAIDTNENWQGTISPAGLAANAWARSNINWQVCDSNGDMAYKVEATGSGTFDITLYYKGVQLR